MPTSSTSLTHSDSLENLFAEAGQAATAPLWTVMHEMVPPEPNPKAVPHVWRYDELRPLLGRAGRLIGAEQAERRVLMLVNPALRPPFTTDTLFGGLQLILPGETAPAHRHTAFALRFIIEGSRGFTAVGGEKVTMERGDMILTPSWEFHDHGHEGTGEMVWLDGLDLPLWRAIPVNFAEGYGEPRYPSAPASGVSRLKFPWAEMQAALDAAPGEWATAPYRARDADRPISSRIAASGERISAGARSPLRRETTSAVYHVYEGEGVTRVGERELRWRARDTFAIPAWMPYAHAADTNAYLFRFDDRPLIDALGVYRAS
ncbi:MAG: cupin domain-containing protein [Candidatus Eremiobacteraeota bacterium]|nr:cupin domain-containing protein [Candidatus Eremiobacteraeota bacterium]MBV8355041.1 cupin domain-containing protein [Candidatus Eremiobacteraeota bacterium]